MYKNNFGILQRLSDLQILKEKIILTLVILLISRLGIFIPIPGIDYENFYKMSSNNQVINFINIFAGGGFSTIGIFALGIVPYINASIIIQLITPAIPLLEKLQKEEGDFGRQKINQITRYLTLIWSIIQSIGITFWLKKYSLEWSVVFIFQTVIILSTGAMLMMWFSEVITENGLGNGSSILIAINIIASLQKSSNILKLNFETANYIQLFIFIVLLISVLILIIYVQEATRRIPIVSAKQLSRGIINSYNNYLPLKLNQSGIMPIIFAASLTLIPIYLSQIIINDNIRTSIMVFNNILFNNKIIYTLVYFTLIFFFSYFYTNVFFNTNEITENLKKMAVSIPGIRPGIKTKIYLKKILNRLTFLGASFLSFVAIIPSVMETITQISLIKGIGATSLLILIGVAIDIVKQIKTYLLSKNYEHMIE
uniref:Protein translocase subunit SecY n=1 Tax=Galdieria sulphuraria TaxID=130081 RepID=A0A075W2A4_GALSU|nr:preprotein translocase subunit SecY [Galdieria sulphuraria]AIG92503.1 preprotein translocase subunit SecY [Galdieria sulphuraria]